MVEFVDTNVLLYLISHDTRKAAIAERLLSRSPWISVQVLNEMTAVMTRKAGMSIAEAREVTATISACCTVTDIAVLDHDLACSIVQRFGFQFYDAVLIATALRCEATRLYTEDLQHGQVLLRSLRIVDPFR